MKYIKNHIKPMLFLIIGISMLSIIQNKNLIHLMGKIQTNIQNGLQIVKITEEKSEINEDNLDIRFKVPSIHYKEKQVEKKINNYIRTNIREYINIQKQINKINRFNEKHIINISYNVVFEDENIINLIIEKNTTWGEKNYKLEKDSYVFSLKTGERIYLDEFLKNNEDYRSLITNEIEKVLDENHPFYDNLEIDKNTNYYIEDRYINIYFNPYKQSGDKTQYEFKIPYDIFKNKIEASANFFFH